MERVGAEQEPLTLLLVVGMCVFSVFSREGWTVGMCVSANENLPNGHIVVLARFLPFNFQSKTFP